MAPFQRIGGLLLPSKTLIVADPITLFDPVSVPMQGDRVDVYAYQDQWHKGGGSGVEGGQVVAQVPGAQPASWREVGKAGLDSATVGMWDASRTEKIKSLEEANVDKNTGQPVHPPEIVRPSGSYYDPGTGREMVYSAPFIGPDFFSTTTLLSVLTSKASDQARRLGLPGFVVGLPGGGGLATVSTGSDGWVTVFAGLDTSGRTVAVAVTF
jgi:hypothetical protein